MRSIWISFSMLAFAAPAGADEPPPPSSATAAETASVPEAGLIASPAVARPAAAGSLTLPAGKLSLSLTLEIESATDKLGEPIAIAPDVSYGVNDKLTLSLVHSKFAITGLRAVTGGGLCLGDACAQTYNNVGAEAVYSLTSGRFAAAALVGVHALNLDQGFYDAKLGARLRYTMGRLSVSSLPSVLVAMTERADVMGVRVNPDLYFIPVAVNYRLLPKLTAGLGSGFKGAFHSMGKTWEIPFGALVTYSVDRRITLGASLIFGKVFGGADDPPEPAPPATGLDYRGTQLWVTVVP